ncbi:DUF3995 domain-containing protein [Tenacibaculum sp. Bg11-29]|uniref:DUF3995 domain-containing protein n=1 Tax=Tenacibaculum sp. Bg11-29 TaxID=2058306 RepID=UPI000C34D923|nr:DUF3995 domain-containing protein [Tenacibaculum sp. Bg11-29]PKH52019.1 DUF3995 domain-containing protein [Tenacibaculum sp. Bg11-29]
MVYFLGWIAFFILIFLSVIHFLWSAGVKWGYKAVLPTDEENNLKLKPSKIITIIVAFLLAFAAILYAVKAKIVTVHFVPNSIINTGLYIIGIVFFLRAIGDFKYVGFFKKTKGTLFAKNDTKYFSPLCLFLSIISVVILYM